MIAESSGPAGLGQLSDSQLIRIDQICDGFESAWHSKRRPRIEEYLDADPGPGRKLLLQELVLIDAECRTRFQECPQTADYQKRFPELDEQWLDLQLSPRRVSKPKQVCNETSVSMARPLNSSAENDASSKDDGLRQLGHFQLLEKVGVGAFGTVWRALDLRLNRTVALKVPHAYLIQSGEEVARFFREARAAAQLRHPGIVTVHEVAVVDGLPVLVSDFVTGRSLRDLIAIRRPPHHTAAALVARIADALACAHSIGAIHRDIKPGNIMLDSGSTQSGTGEREISSLWPGEPRIVDFGLAFLDEEAVRLTHDGAIIGTPAYMSPEQAAGQNSTRPIDHRTDIYSLGVVLYELLTGVIPFAGTRCEVLARVMDSEPTSPRRLDPSLPRDLESICQKAMAKEPRQRYDSAGELADDLRSFLGGEPVRARAISLWERSLRRAHRRPAQAALVLMGPVTVLTLIVLAVGYRYHLRLERLLQTTESARSAETQERRRAESFLYFHRMALAEREWTANNVDRVERLLDDCPGSLRGWEWRYLKQQCLQSLLSMTHTLPASGSWSVTCARYSTDGRILASSSKDGTVRLWDSATGRALRLLGRHKHFALSLAFQPGTHLLASGGDEGDILIWDIKAGSLVRTLPKSTDAIYALAYSPDGSLLVSGHGYPPKEEVDHMRGRGVVRCWEASTGRLLRTLCGHTQNVMGVAFSPDGQTLASVSGSSIAVPQVASKPGELIVRKTGTGELIRKICGHAGPLTSVAYHPDGSVIATSSWDRTVKLWDASTGDLRRSLLGHHDWVHHVEFSPDGRRIATGSADGAVKIWKTASNHESYTLRGHKQNVTCVAFSPDGRRLASASSDQTVKIWDATTNPEVLTWRGAIGPIARIAYFPDGHRLLVAGNSEDPSGRVHPRLTIVDTSQAVHEGEPEGESGLEFDRPVDGIAVRPDGRLVAAASQTGRIEAWMVGTQRSCFRYEEITSRFQGVAFSRDGRKLATAGQINARTENGEPGPMDTHANGLVIVFDTMTGKPLWRAAGMTTGLIRDITFSPDGRLLATADNTTTVTLWDVATGAIVRQLNGHTRLVSHVAFSPDGQRLASSSWDSTVIVWDPATGREAAALQGHMRSVLCVTFSPDGRRLATSSEDQTVRLWDAETGQEVLTLRGHTDIVPSVAFSPDGNRLVSAGADGTVQIREASTASGAVDRTEGAADETTPRLVNRAIPPEE